MPAGRYRVGNKLRTSKTTGVAVSTLQHVGKFSERPARGATLSRLVRSLARGRLSDKLLSRDHVRSPAGVSHEAQAMSHPSHERALRQEVWTCPGRSSQNHACRVSKHLEMHRLPSEALKRCLYHASTMCAAVNALSAPQLANAGKGSDVF